MKTEKGSMMKTYQGKELIGLPDGWYWAKRFPDCKFLEAYPVYVSNRFNQKGHKVTTIHFGHRQECYLFREDSGMESDGCDAILYGPIEVPNF